MRMEKITLSLGEKACKDILAKKDKLGMAQVSFWASECYSLIQKLRNKDNETSLRMLSSSD